MKSWFFNSLLMGSMVLALYYPMRGLPDRTPRLPAKIAIDFQSVTLPQPTSPFRLGGAWEMRANDRRFGGLSALAIDRGRFVAVSDLGAAVRFDPPSTANPQASIHDLDEGPGDPRFKTARDAEALMRDPGGGGWLVAYEQRHSLWRYDDNFANGASVADLGRPDWKRNRGIEGMVAEGSSLLLAAENGREAMWVDDRGVRRMAWPVGIEVADAATAPDGTHWLLLRGKGISGISQSIAPLIRTVSGYRLGTRWPLPKAPLDNYEGMAIVARPGGGWRYWLVTDDGHRIFARTLLVALDLDAPPTSKRPATSTGRIINRNSDD